VSPTILGSFNELFVHEHATLRPNLAQIKQIDAQLTEAITDTQ
jgi:hypothetical protein